MNLEQQLASLFGRGGGGAAAPAGPLLEFRAGKMILSGTTVTADPRRGKVVLTDDNGLLRFQWKPRPSGAVEENLIIFPDDCKVELVPECTTGRVILLRFTSDPSKKLFYWLQEPNAEKDEEIMKKLTDFLARGVNAAAPAPGAAGEGDGVGPGFSEQEQLMRIIASQGASRAAPSSRSSVPASSAAARAPSPSRAAAPAAAPAAASSAASSGSAAPALSGAQLRSAADVIAQAAANMQAMAEAQASRSLSAILDPEHVVPLLESDPDIVSAVLEHLPEGQRTPELLRDQLRSPQLHQTLNRLTIAFNQGQGAAILQQLGLPVTNGIGVDSLLEALRQFAAKENGEKKDDKMDVDKPDQGGSGGASGGSSSS